MTANDPLVGATIGNYRVTDVLGEGGMGKVYRAQHPDIGRTVAIKVVAVQVAQHAAVLARFKAEALAVNKIRHPNIIDVSDFGGLPDGRPYFVMEFLDGMDLGKRLRQSGGRLTPRAAWPILAQTLDALAAAHEAGIIHRDLKPDNIYLSRRGGSEQVKLLDFGIAKLRAESSVQATTDGTLMGTPAYMSPEQALGRMSQISPASDIYSMGVILYEMFTGTTPFRSDSFGELLMAHAQKPPPRPSVNVPGFDPRLEAVILRCLEKEPAARYPTARALRDALDEILAEQPAKAVEATLPAQPIESVAIPATRATEPRRRTPLWIGIIVIALVGGGAAAIALRHRGPAPKSPAEMPQLPEPGPLLDGKELPPSAR